LWAVFRVDQTAFNILLMMMKKKKKAGEPPEL
jgi:ABC-type transporter Mla MlaB component